MPFHREQPMGTHSPGFWSGDALRIGAPYWVRRLPEDVDWSGVSRPIAEIESYEITAVIQCRSSLCNRAGLNAAQTSAVAVLV